MHDVGSGPAAPDPTTVDDARLDPRCATRRSFVISPWSRPLKPNDAGGDPCLVCDHARAPQPRRRARSRPREGRVFSSRPRPRRRPMSQASPMNTSRSARSLTLRRSSRSQRGTIRSNRRRPARRRGPLARTSQRSSGRDLPPAVQFMAAASDGVDGSSGTGGAIVKARSFQGRRGELDPRDRRVFDTGLRSTAHTARHFRVGRRG